MDDNKNQEKVCERKKGRERKKAQTSAGHGSFLFYNSAVEFNQNEIRGLLPALHTHHKKGRLFPRIHHSKTQTNPFITQLLLHFQYTNHNTEYRFSSFIKEFYSISALIHWWRCCYWIYKLHSAVQSSGTWSLTIFLKASKVHKLRSPLLWWFPFSAQPGSSRILLLKCTRT